MPNTCDGRRRELNGQNGRLIVGRKPAMRRGFSLFDGRLPNPARQIGAFGSGGLDAEPTNRAHPFPGLPPQTLDHRNPVRPCFSRYAVNSGGVISRASTIAPEIA